MSQQPLTVMGIETSCDETSVGVVRNGQVLSNVIASQQVHSSYGGVVPEMASREHERLLATITANALDHAGCRIEDIHGIGVTSGPGLMGALLVGVSFAKGFSLRHQIPLVNINHIEAHLLANFIDSPLLEYPFLCLLVSGGHTQIIRVDGFESYQVIGTTIDDAAGEAFDKVARLLDLGYPGGPPVETQAAQGDPDAFDFPRGLSDSQDLNFSFSGLKTAVLYAIQPFIESQRKDHTADVCASFQQAVVDSLTGKIRSAVKQTGIHRVTIAGGVAANQRLRSRMQSVANELQVQLYYPAFEYCTDNGAMIAYAAHEKFRHHPTDSSHYSFSAEPRLTLDRVV